MAKDFTHPKVVEGYDEHIRKLIPGYELIHQNIHAILKTYLTENAHVLVVGCGTGYELKYLSQTFPAWSFTAIDPSETMTVKAKQLLKQQNLDQNIKFIQGDTSVLSSMELKFDAALSILVSHFVPTAAKLKFFSEIAESLKEDAICLSYDLLKIYDQNQLNILRNLALETGLSTQQSQHMIERVEQDFDLVSVEELEKILLDSGFKTTQHFMQVQNYYGWLSRK